LTNDPIVPDTIFFASRERVPHLSPLQKTIKLPRSVSLFSLRLWRPAGDSARMSLGLAERRGNSLGGYSSIHPPEVVK
jgi:hypothetical protein